MCRFLLVKSAEAIRPSEILLPFAEMASTSKALDGAWQGDGWGVCWQTKQGIWRLRKSIRPVWKETDEFERIPPCRIILAHARSSSFPEHREVVSFNQPYIDNGVAFVFNGFLKGVRLSSSVEGQIGAQKTWTLLSGLLKQHLPGKAILKLISLMLEKSREIQAMNIGICDGQKMYAYCHPNDNPDYYDLHSFHKKGLDILCSEPFKDFEFFPVQQGTVLSF